MEGVRDLEVVALNGDIRGGWSTNEKLVRLVGRGVSRGISANEARRLLDGYQVIGVSQHVPCHHRGTAPPTALIGKGGACVRGPM